MKKLLTFGAVVVLSLSMLAGCGNSTSNETTAESSAEQSSDATVDETEHTHNYTETITVEATCTENGTVSFVCECGDSYTEVITATGHVFNEYVYNEDATFTADGTETATCACGETDTRTKSDSKLEYTYTDLDKTMYAKSSVNVRSLPSTDGEKLGGLSKAQEVHVTGQCNETSWYRIDYNGSVAYVSNSYLVNDKPVEETRAPEEPTQPSQPEECPYPLYTIIDEGSNVYTYDVYGEGTSRILEIVHLMCERYGCYANSPELKLYSQDMGYYNGKLVKLIGYKYEP